jgi:hypothetical protein
MKQHKLAVKRAELLQHCKQHIENINMKAHKDLEWELI